MELDVEILPAGIFKSLREWLAELKDLEASGAGTPAICEMLVDLHELLDKLDTMLLEHPRKTSH
jgi:hypothetical protein